MCILETQVQTINHLDPWNQMLCSFDISCLSSSSFSEHYTFHFGVSSSFNAILPKSSISLNLLLWIHCKIWMLFLEFISLSLVWFLSFKPDHSSSAFSSVRAFFLGFPFPPIFNKPLYHSLIFIHRLIFIHWKSDILKGRKTLGYHVDHLFIFRKNESQRKVACFMLLENLVMVMKFECPSLDS